MNETLLAVLGTVVVAAIPLIKAWFKLQTAKLEIQRQAALGAVCEVEAYTEPPADLSNSELHEMARDRIVSRLKASDVPKDVDALIREAVERKKKMPPSIPPPRDRA